MANTNKINVRVSDNLYMRIKKYVEKNEMNVAEFIRAAIMFYFKNHQE